MRFKKSLILAPVVLGILTTAHYASITKYLSLYSFGSIKVSFMGL